MTEQRCENCGRTGTRGFVTYDATTVTTPCGPERLPAMTLCAGRKACQLRAYRLTPASVRAARRWSDEAAS